MPTVSPDERLRCAASFVRQGAVFADVGTDHAILPVFLMEQGIISRAVASDISAGPLAAAAKTVQAAGLDDRILLVLSDGLSALAPYQATDIAVCGMGGELIISILDRAPFSLAGVRLILQPMSRAEELRAYLAAHGYAVPFERICPAKGKMYTCLCTTYVGIPRKLSPLETELGDIATMKDDPLFLPYLAFRIRRLRRKVDGMHKGGEVAAKEETLLAEMEDLYEHQRTVSGA